VHSEEQMEGKEAVVVYFKVLSQKEWGKPARVEGSDQVRLEDNPEWWGLN